MAKYGVLWVSDYSGASIGNLDEARKSANYLRHVLNGTPQVVRGDGAAFPNPPLACVATLGPPAATMAEADVAQPASGDEPVEEAMLAYYAGHGKKEGLRMNLPAADPGHLIAPVEIQWGQGKLRWACLDVCELLAQPDVATRWKGSFAGVRAVVGWHTPTSPQIQRGLILAWYLNQREHVTDAWVRACEESESEFPSWASLRPTRTAGVVQSDSWPTSNSTPSRIKTIKEYVYIRSGDAEPFPGLPSTPAAPLGTPPSWPAPPALFPWDELTLAQVKARAKDYAKSLGWLPSTATAYSVCDEEGSYWFRVRMRAKDQTDGTKGTLDVYPPTGAVRWVSDDWKLGGPNNVAAAAAWTATPSKLALMDAANAFLHAHDLQRDLEVDVAPNRFNGVTLSERFDSTGVAVEGAKLLARHVQCRDDFMTGPLSRIVVTLAPDLSVLACYRALPCKQPSPPLAPPVSLDAARVALAGHLASRGEDPALAATFRAKRQRYAGPPGVRQAAPIPVYTFDGSIAGDQQRTPRLFHVTAVRLGPWHHARYAASMIGSLVLA